MSLELLRRAMEYTETVVCDLTSDDPRLPTPCDGWDAGRVLLHLADVADGLIALVETGDLALPEPARTDDPDPVSIAGESLTRLAATLSTTSEKERAQAAARAGAIEFTMHGWDIGVARDSGHLTPADLANDVWTLASSLVSDEARGSNFAAAVDVPATATPSDRLAGFLGRQTVRISAEARTEADAGQDVRIPAAPGWSGGVWPPTRRNESGEPITSGVRAPTSTFTAPLPFPGFSRYGS